MVGDPLDTVERGGVEMLPAPAVGDAVRKAVMVEDDAPQMRVAEGALVDEDEVVDADAHTEGRERCPADEPVVPEPGYPGGPPLEPWNPAPANRKGRPAPVVERPAPGLGRHPRPTGARPRPVAFGVGAPITGHVRPPHAP